MQGNHEKSFEEYHRELSDLKNKSLETLLSKFERKYGMTNEWLKFEDSMPTLYEKVEVKFNDEILEATLLLQKNDDEATIYFSLQNKLLGEMNLGKVIGWRPLPERRPDFDKLKENDFISFENEEKEGIITYSGYFKGILGDLMQLYMLKKYGNMTSFYKKSIRKILRINVETKEFEEIYRE